MFREHLPSALWLCVLLCGAFACNVYDPSLLSDLPRDENSAGTGPTAGTEPTAGTAPPPSGGTMAPPMAGTAPAAGTGGSGVMTPPPEAGTASPPPPAGDPQCGGGLTCVGGTCTDPTTNEPPPCTAGGNECDAVMGSACVLGSGSSTGVCSKACGAEAMVQCPAPLTCTNFLGSGNFVCTDSSGFPPACTIGGTECDAYGFMCSTAAGITACWRNCAP